MDLVASFSRVGMPLHAGRAEPLSGPLWQELVVHGVAALCFLAIALCLVGLVRTRRDAGFARLLVLFAGFVVTRSVTHLLDIGALWQSNATLHALSQALSVLTAIAAAVAVWRLVPTLRKLPRMGELQEAVAAMEREIGRRRSVEQHAADVEETLALTLASIDAGLIATDVHGNVVRLNAVAQRITGWDPLEAVGRSYWEVLQAVDRPAYAEGLNLVQVAVDVGATVEVAHRLVALSRQGTRTPIELNVALTRGDDGSVRGAIAVLKDMTRVDRAEEDVRRLASIVESSSDAIIGKDLDGRITSWNLGATRLFGYSAAEAIGQSVRMLIPPDRLDEEMDILRKLVDGRAIPAFDTLRLRKDGRPVPISVTISPMRDGAGRIVGGSKIARDVSERLATLAALSESEARLRFALEVAQVGDWDLDVPTGNIRRSIRHDRCFGYDSLRPDWSLTTFFAHVHPADRAEVALSYRKALLSSQDWDAQCRVVWPDGSLHWIRIQGSTRYDTGNANRMLGIVSDLTQQKASEETRLLTQRLESENRQIQEANRLKSQFLANMSHELRSPMNAIIGFSDLLYADGPPIDGAKRHQYIGHIRTSGRHLLQLINDVLDLSKVESGKFEFFPEAVDLAALILEVRTVLFTQLQRKRLEVEVDVADAVARVETDPARLKQMLYNYLSNAIKFSHDNGLIMVRALPERRGFFRLEVEDAGIGIAQADLPRLFVEFQQLDASYTKRHQGTGLGLSLTRRMVEAQGGSVGARSELGRGSVFHIVLPMSPAALREPVPGSGTPSSQQRAQWLVLEDNVDDLSRIAGALKESGHRVDVASSVEQALSRLEEKDYDALSLDLMGAAPGGLDILAKMRGDPRRGPSAVAALTLDAPSAGTAAFSVADVLAKPLRADEIVHALKRFGLVGAGATVLVIDDDSVALALMKATLEDCGVSPVLFTDGRAALQEVARQAPAAIIIDLLMPEFSGFDVLDALSTQEGTRDIPVFVWTHMSLTDSEYDLLASSAAAILRKGGGNVESLLEKLRRWRPPIVPVWEETRQ